MLAEGKYNAKPSDWMVTKVGKNETPAIQVAMQVEHGEETVEMVWTGFFTDKARARTVEALKLMGLTAKNQGNLAKGTIGAALDVNKAVQVVIEHETNEKGKVFPRIRWINAIHSFSGMDPSAAMKGQAILNSLGLAADLIEMGATGENDLPV